MAVPSAPVAPPSAPPSLAPSATTPPPRTERAPLSPEARRGARTAVREGRTAARAEDWTRARAAFGRALALDPSPRVRCEAGYVTFRGGDVPAAMEAIDLALTEIDVGEPPEALRVPLAMCLYNAGLVYRAASSLDGEDRDADLWAAREALERSLALRESATVRARLAAVVADLVAAAGEATEPEALEWPSTTSEGDVVRALLARTCREARVGDAACASPAASSEVVRPAEPGGGAAPAFEARLVTTRAGDRSDVWLLRRDAEVVLVGHLGGGAGARGTTATAEWRDLVPGAGSELVVSRTTSTYWTGTTSLVACASARLCVELIVEESELVCEDEGEYDDEDDDESDDDADDTVGDDAIDDEEAPPSDCSGREAGYVGTVVYGEGTVRIGCEIGWCGQARDYVDRTLTWSELFLDDENEREIRWPSFEPPG